MYLQAMGSRPGSISASVYMDIVRTLHGSTVAILSAAISHVIGGVVGLRETGDIVSGALMIVGLVVVVIRACEVFAFRRRELQGKPIEPGEAILWVRLYASGTVASAVVHGLFAARSLMLDSQIYSTIAVGIAFGCSAGLLTRLSLLPYVVLANLCALGLPTIVLSLVLLDVPHLALAALIVIYLAGTFEMARHAFNSAIEQITLKEQFAELARLDPLTGVFNRSHLTSELPRLVADGRDGLVAIHAIDLDHFKAANDRFGHPVGDALLKEVAKRLTSLAGPRGTVVRMGGDEFILVQSAARSLADVQALAEQIVDSISAPYSIQGHDIVIGVSVGIAVAPEDGRSAEALLLRSDKALYQAKSNRGGYVFSSDTATKVLANKPAARSFAA